MENANLVTYNEFIIDTHSLEYKAVWDCQVDWTDECIFYDAETGKLIMVDNTPAFVCDHQLKVTKHEYQEHTTDASLLKKVTLEELKELAALTT